MNISTIQKKRLLETLYKNQLAEGRAYPDQYVFKDFVDYFTYNKPGFPIKIDYDVLRSTNKTNVELLNNIMASSLLNVDILFDALYEGNEELMATITAMNKKLNNLKAKRSALESKIDDLLFANNNTDGFFYSFSDNFSSLTNVDLTLTNGYVNTVTKHCSLPSLNSERFNVLTVDNVRPGSITGTLLVDGTASNISIDTSDFESLFDGLTDTSWSYTAYSPSINYMTLVLNIPISGSTVISKIEGVVDTISPVSILVRANPSDSTKSSQIKIFESRKDFSTFAVSIPSDTYSSIEIVMYKTEPDSYSVGSLGGASNSFMYKFGLRDLIIGSKYYDRNSSIVSRPISLPSGNKKIFIDKVSFSAVTQEPQGTNINYYVAKDVAGATNVSDFNWIPLSNYDSNNPSYPTVVDFSGANTKMEVINYEDSDSDLVLIPLNSESKNANEINPMINLYSGKTIYRVCSLNDSQDYLNPVLYSGINSLIHNYFINSDQNAGVSNDLDYWSTQIATKDANLLTSVLKDQAGSIYPGINSGTSGHIQTSILCESDQEFNYTITKSNYDFALSVYLNGVNIAHLPKGTLNKSVKWEFKKGINTLIITYDKPTSGKISFNLMEGTSLSRFGVVFAEYFNYLDPFDFANKVNEGYNYFTIQKVFGSKEILSSKKIESESRLSFTSLNQDQVESIRFRVDLSRYDNPFVTPILESYTIKFKHES